MMIVVGCFFVGLGVGMLTDNLGPAVVIGIGAGFIFGAFVGRRELVLKRFLALRGKPREPGEGA